MLGPTSVRRCRRVDDRAPTSAIGQNRKAENEQVSTSDKGKATAQMSAMGHKQTSRRPQAMSALPPKADKSSMSALCQKQTFALQQDFLIRSPRQRAA